LLCQDSQLSVTTPKELSNRTPGVRLHLTGPTVSDPQPARGRIRCHHVSQRREHSAETAGSPGPPTGSRTPIYYPDNSAGREQTPRLGESGATACPQTQIHARLPSCLGKTWPPTAFNAGGVKCALPQQSPRRLSPGCTVDRALPRCTVQPLAPLTPRTSVCYTS